MNHLSFKARRFGRKADSFTLVEVVIAMAIMTVTLVPLMGLMTGGLVEVGSNIDNNQAVNICQQVVTAAQQGSFHTLATNAVIGVTPTVITPTPTPAGTPVLSYFTAEADPVLTSSGANIAYTASVIYTTNAVTSPTPPLITMVVQVKKTPGGHPNNNAPVATFVETISCQDSSGYIGTTTYD